jgi:hypothetical protein
MSVPVISVVVVSDYAGCTPGSLDDYRHCLRDLAQDRLEVLSGVDEPVPAESIEEGADAAQPDDLGTRPRGS